MLFICCLKAGERKKQENITNKTYWPTTPDIETERKSIARVADMAASAAHLLLNGKMEESVMSLSTRSR